jgi:hypothetical protein
MDKLALLLERIEQGSIIPKLQIQFDEVDELLNKRDEPIFDEPWVLACRELEARKGSGKDADPRVTRLREITFLLTYEIWKASDLAAEISDDFGLMGDALATNYQNEWVNGLLYSYWKCRLPCGLVPSRPGRMGDIIA